MRGQLGSGPHGDSTAAAWSRSLVGGGRGRGDEPPPSTMTGNG